MFTGIVTERGRVVEIVPNEAEDTATLVVEAPRSVEGLPLGGSIAVNGVCLTATSVEDGRFSAVAIGETLRLTTTGALTPGSLVNLERCVRPDGHLDGHIVQGHVDGVGTLISRSPQGRWDLLRVGMPNRLARFVALKGSIAIDGVSLTVTGVSEPSAEAAWLEVGLIPATLEETGLGSLKPGDGVNLEVDVFAKHAERLLAFVAPEAASPRPTGEESPAQTSKEQD
ncbi:riboflavin synthase [Falsarthrobacter nasiphocae]|uniref:Riboflavin synthase n=1 Tax=Falsarthrobacter nasiphocae TaxID=189863 RepID=A0AAE3YFT8_9MICC|nr:riboflavin synthase [Falsarthrobacter nasiphocae]MDR6891236.1 riboflavin synthase alpha subunit [Falsarthrobacter nasiphocae]